ncbi:MAG: SDR family NAD(P)-dependent oxidoreductase [Gammaproteobacteria bacterium]
MRKKLLISGASSGIGLATAEHFIEHGYSVMNLSRRPSPLDAVQNVRCDFLASNVDDILTSKVAPWLADATKLVVVHNAARLRSDTVENTDSDALRDVLEINIVAANRINRCALPGMPPGSSVVYVGSTLSEKAVANSFSYVTSKHAVVGMMRATCQDLVGRNIHTLCVCPGFTDTQMLREHVPEEFMPTLGQMSAFGRLIEPTEIARTIYWSSGNPVLNGAVLHANLGQIER